MLSPNSPERSRFAFAASTVLLTLLAPAATAGDFNGDGIEDIVIGVPGETLSGRTNAGKIHVVYGSPGGASTNVTQDFSTNGNGSGLGNRADNFFGIACATGDFDEDGYDDLAVSGREQGGEVHVMYGSSAGLVTSRTQVITRNSFNPYGDSSANALGHSLAAGDFDGDGYTDLLVGAPRSRVAAAAGAGMILQFYGGSSGLSTHWCRTMHQDVGTVSDRAEGGDRFGWCLSVADFDQDGRDDVAVGIPGEDVGSVVDAGMVQILFGDGLGISSRSRTYHQNTSGIRGFCETMDRFGTSLASGRLNSDSYPDLAIGIPAEDVASIRDAGAVQILLGSAYGPSSSGDYELTQNHLGVGQGTQSGATPERDELFGFSLEIADHNGDGYDDLCIGTPRENVRISYPWPISQMTYLDAGAVHYIPGAPYGLRLQHANDFFTLAGDTGLTLGTGQFFGDSRVDLIVGDPLQTPRGQTDAGQALINVSGPYGPSDVGSSSHAIDQDSPNMPSRPETGDLFGAGALGSGNGPADPLENLSFVVRTF